MKSEMKIDTKIEQDSRVWLMKTKNSFSIFQTLSENEHARFFTYT